MLVLTNEECILKKYTTWFILISVGNISLHVLYLCLSVFFVSSTHCRTCAHICIHKRLSILCSRVAFCIRRVFWWYFQCYATPFFSVVVEFVWRNVQRVCRHETINLPNVNICVTKRNGKIIGHALVCLCVCRVGVGAVKFVAQSWSNTFSTMFIILLSQIYSNFRNQNGT